MRLPLLLPLIDFSLRMNELDCVGYFSCSTSIKLDLDIGIDLL